MEGRDSAKKNASVNGIYAPMAAGHDGLPAYEKVGEKNGEPATRFLYYSAQKKRWKISDSVGDTKNGFAFVKLTVEKAPPVDLGNARWSVFDRKSEGYNEDPAVR